MPCHVPLIALKYSLDSAIHVAWFCLCNATVKFTTRELWGERICAMLADTSNIHIFSLIAVEYVVDEVVVTPWPQTVAHRSVRRKLQ